MILKMKIEMNQLHEENSDLISQSLIIKEENRRLREFVNSQRFKKLESQESRITSEVKVSVIDSM